MPTIETSIALRDDPEYGPIFGPLRILPDGRIAYVQPLVFGRARICVGDPASVHDGY